MRQGPQPEHTFDERADVYSRGAAFEILGSKTSWDMLSWILLGRKRRHTIFKCLVGNLEEEALLGVDRFRVFGHD